MKSSKRRATKDYMVAIHEAGHVMATLALGRRFNFVELGEAPHRLLDGTMSTRGGRVNHGDEPISLHDEVAELWGGVAAQKIFRPRDSWAYYGLTGGTEDFACISAVCGEHNADPRRQFMADGAFTDRMSATAVALLKANWSSVIKVADALVAKRHLTYEEVIEVCSNEGTTPSQTTTGRITVAHQRPSVSRHHEKVRQVRLLVLRQALDDHRRGRRAWRPRNGVHAREAVSIHPEAGAGKLHNRSNTQGRANCEGTNGN